MTSDERIREAAATAVADFPPIPDEVVARLGTLLAPLADESDEPLPTQERAA
jgi:hypothetical protein